MARKNVPITADDDLDEREGAAAARTLSFEESPLDARMLDLDDEVESPFLRGQKRVPVRRGALPRKTAGRVKLVLAILLIAGSIALVWVAVYRYGTTSWRFRMDSSDDIEILGSGTNVSRAQVMEVMGGDIDRNIFFVPLDDRKKQLEAIPWVQSASIMRFLPNRMKIVVKERTPVAFAQISSHIALIDASGVVMEMQPGQQASYSFPVIVGMPEAEPRSTRAARIKLYLRLVQELDSGVAQYSHDLSDVDLSDPDDVKATVTDPHGAVLVHLGSSNFLERFKIYVAHVQEWRAQFARLESVDLRYDHQVIVNPDSKAAETKGTTAASGSGTTTAQKPMTAPKSTASRSKGKKHT